MILDPGRNSDGSCVNKVRITIGTLGRTAKDREGAVAVGNPAQLIRGEDHHQGLLHSCHHNSRRCRPRKSKPPYGSALAASPLSMLSAVGSSPSNRSGTSITRRNYARSIILSTNSTFSAMPTISLLSLAPWCSSAHSRSIFPPLRTVHPLLIGSALSVRLLPLALWPISSNQPTQ